MDSHVCIYAYVLLLFEVFELISFILWLFLPSLLSFYYIFCLLDGCFLVDFGQFIRCHIILLS